MLSVSQYNLPTLREDLAEEVSRLADKLNSLSFVRHIAVREASRCTVT